MPNLTFELMDPPGQLAAHGLTLRHMTYEDALGRMFEMHLDLTSAQLSLNLDDLLGARVRVEVEVQDCEIDRPGSPNKEAARRTIIGHVSQFVQTFAKTGEYGYRATVVPKLWFLSLSSHCRVFAGKSIPDIVHEVLSEHDIDYERLPAASDYPALEYCVQYHETDFQFVSRLLERAGIFYFFTLQPTHGDVKSMLVLADNMSDFRHAQGFNVLGQTVDRSGTGPHLWSWTEHRRLRPDRSFQKRYDFTVTASQLGAYRALTSNKKSMYEYGTVARVREGMVEHDTMHAQANLRVEQWQARRALTTAVSNAPVLHAGTRFTLNNHDRDDLEGEFVVIGSRFEHHWDQEAEVTGAAARARDRTTLSRLRPPLMDSAFAATRAHRPNEPLEPAMVWPQTLPPMETSVAGPPFECELLLMRRAAQFRPERVTPRPVISGPQTAVVVGEADSRGVGPTDEFGRVMVQFHWDHERADGSQTVTPMWVRVSQTWAGKRYGSMALPHPGHEVIVEFLDGDPDQPIITGRVYNRNNMPPMKLPDHDHETVVARDKAGNEIIMNAKDGDEHVRVYTPGNWYDFNVGDSFEVELGLSSEITAGAKHELTGGISASETVGAGIEVQLGSFNSLMAGQAFEAKFAHSASVSLGTSFEWSKGPKVENSDANNTNMADGFNVLASKMGTRLVCTMPPSTLTGMVSASPGRVRVSAGSGIGGLPDTSKPAKALLAANLLGAVAGVTAGVSATLAGVAVGAFKDDDDDWVKIAAITGAGVTGVTALAAALASGAATIPLVLMQEAEPHKLVPTGPGSGHVTVEPAMVTTLVEPTRMTVTPDGVNITTPGKLMVNTSMVLLG